MPSGNGARAKQTRERKLKEGKPKAGSQLKINAAAANIMCNVCRQTFLCTASETTLREHLNRHDGTDFAVAFPDFDPSAKKKKAGAAAEPDKPKVRA